VYYIPRRHHIHRSETSKTTDAGLREMRERTKVIDHVERSDEALAARTHIILYAYYMAAAADISHANFQRRMRTRKIGLSVAIKSYLYTCSNLFCTQTEHAWIYLFIFKIHNVKCRILHIIYNIRYIVIGIHYKRGNRL